MSKISKAAEGENVTIVAVNIEQSLADRWRITMRKCERSGKFHATGVGVISSQQR
jgi:hypothetical protein